MSANITYGWPGRGPVSAEQLPDVELLDRLRRVEVVDRRHRMNPSVTADEKQRRGINLIHYDLWSEAVQRGFRDPYGG